MTDSNFDNKIKTGLTEVTKDILPPEDMLYRIKNFSAAEEPKMKKLKPFKTVVICIAAIMALSVGVIGAGKLLYVESHSSSAEAIKHFPTQQELEKVIDFKPKYLQKLGKYDFESCVPVHSKDVGENGENLENYTGMNFFYKTDKGILALDTDPKPTNFDEVDFDISEYKGVKYYYDSVLFKCVPPDYQLTDEDKEMQEAGKLQISVGSDKVTVEKTQHVVWEQDGVSYCLSDIGVEIDKNEFVDMAKSIMDAK